MRTAVVNAGSPMLSTLQIAELVGVGNAFRSRYVWLELDKLASRATSTGSRFRATRAERTSRAL